MTLSAMRWRSVIVAISDAEIPTFGCARAASVRSGTCVRARTASISRTKAPATARASLDVFSEPLLAGSNQDWAGAMRRPSPFRPALPDPDALFRGEEELSVANVERLVPCVEVADDERPHDARRVDVDRQ